MIKIIDHDNDDLEMEVIIVVVRHAEFSQGDHEAVLDCQVKG